MSWHIFFMVWGDPFVARFAQLVVPFLAMPRNLPAMARDASVILHPYTDAGSREAVARALQPLADHCRVDIRLFDASVAQGLSGPDYKYEIQRRCVQELARSLDGGTIVLLDSNFVLADGALDQLARRRADGYCAATTSVLRVTTEKFAAALNGALAANNPLDPRTLQSLCRDSHHHITDSFFVDAEQFTPYPSQLSWRVELDGFVNRNFLPHPIMIPVTDKVGLYQSTMDYDLVLRVADDPDIYVCGDTDELLAVKFSADEHQANRSGVIRPTPEDIGLFLLTCTNRRHRLFADAPVLFHTGDSDARYVDAIERSQKLIDDAYAWIDQVATQSGRLNAQMLMYLKSHLGPIEDYMSPQLEPSALRRLR